VCVKYTVVQQWTVINVLKKLINNFGYIAGINDKADNDHQMACIVVCVLLLKCEDSVGHCLETCHFPSDSAACGQAR
jgi:nitric oxide reductase large subunit